MKKKGSAIVIIGLFLLFSRAALFAEVIKEEPKIKGYNYNLKRLLEQAQESLKKVDRDIEQAEIRKRNEERESQVIEHVERGNQLYEAGKLKEAQKEWRKAIEISQNPEMKDYIKESEKRAREEELAKMKEEDERRKRLEAEQKENERKLNEQAKVLYDEAASLYKSKDYEQAQVKFEEASRVSPHYLKAGYYLRRIPEDIRKEKERQGLGQEKAEKAQRELKRRQRQLERKREVKEEAERLEQERKDKKEEKRLEDEKRRLEGQRLKADRDRQKAIEKALQGQKRTKGKDKERGE